MFALETVHAYNFLVLVENVVQWAFWRNEFLFIFTADIYLTLLSIKSCSYGASLSKPHAKLVCTQLSGRCVLIQVCSMSNYNR